MENKNIQIQGLGFLQKNLKFPKSDSKIDKIQKFEIPALGTS